MGELTETSRRTFLISAGAVSLAVCVGGCATGGTPSATPSSAAAGTTVPVGDVPVGSGTIVGSFVVTQPKAGTFQAFSVVCPHQKFPVQHVTDAAIVCGRHGSSFSLADGSVLTGPATTALTPATVTVNGDTLSLSP